MKSERRLATACCLAIALFGTPVLVAGYRLVIAQHQSNLSVVIREIGILLVVALLLWLVKKWEQLPLASMGLHFERVGRSTLRGCLLALILLVVTVGLYFLLPQIGLRIGETKSSSFHPSLWAVTLVMLRAGIAEEVFYRGYAIERLQSLTGNPWVAGLIPLAVFAAAHYSQGVGGVVAAFVLGGIMAIFYLRFRDLIANIFGHSLADLVLNVGLPLVSGG